MADKLREHYKQSEILEVFEMKRSSHNYYRQQKNKIKPDEERVKSKIKQLFDESRQAAGSRTLSRTLQNKGEKIGRFKVRRFMREMELESKQPGKHRYKPATKPSDIADNILNRQFTVSKSNQVWCGDVTYIRVGSSWLYLALVIDLYARRIVGWACSDSPDSQLTIKALQVAYEARGKPEKVLFHSDQGCHYTSKAFIQQLWRYKIRQSMSRRGNCWDNAPMERCFRSFKTEWMPKEYYASFDDAEQDIHRYIKYYNNHRVHSSNGYVTPLEKERKLA
jgi:putative transposase